jgi:hypothetical protein
MTSSAPDEEIFILSDEIIDHIASFFPPPNDHIEKTSQAWAALKALINVIGTVLYELDCHDCWAFTTNVLERSFAQMLKDVPAVRAELEREQRAQSIH